MGPSSRRAPRPLFVPYHVRLVALVVVVALFLLAWPVTRFRRAPRSSPRRRQWRHRGRPRLKRAPLPPLTQSRPISFQRPRLHTPSGLCNRSAVDQWARSTGTRPAGPRASWWTEPIPVRHVAPLSASDAVSRGLLGVLHFKPPVSSKSTRGPT